MKLFKTPRFFKWIFPNKTWGFSRQNNVVYLTFDDGPDPEITPWVLDELMKHGIKATFFCVGENVQNAPELYQRIIHEGHAVGNHSMNHLKGVKVSSKDYERSVEQAAQLIRSDLFRPPYGRITLSQTCRLRKKYRIIMWSWLSYDFDKDVPIDKIMRNAQKQISKGDILVLHDNKKTAERLKFLLPELIALLINKGYTFDKIS
jgi:peptidoglycan/xylan/chitin deacetylase (PgdA/CDA1 family)